MVDPEMLAAALVALDAANEVDPNEVVVRGERGPKELVHARLATEWLNVFAPEPSDALRLAVRAHHVERWKKPRSDHPEGRAGYHRWRRELQAFHADRAAAILSGEGVDEATVDRVRALVTKQGVGRDPEAQIFEDALCLVFIETQFRELAERLGEDKLASVTSKTLAKMSARAIELAQGLPLDPADRQVIERAASG